MTTAKPSLELLRSLTDEHVLRALLAEPRLTRAELATRTGLSKPTVSESVRRLTEAGLLRDTGERTTGRGRVGSYYALADGLGTALVVGIAPEGVVAETVDVRGDVRDRQVRPVPAPAGPADVAEALDAVARAVTRSVTRSGGGQSVPRLAVVSAADPVDRATGRLVHLPDAPFLVGELSPVELLAPLVEGPVTVDNDVHWAARAERGAADPGELEDFAYLHLGDGLGCALVSDGEVRRGASGIAGEVAHLLTVGPGGRAVPFIEVFAELGVRRAGSTAVDSALLLTRIRAADPPGDPAAPADPAAAAGGRILGALTEALCGVLSAIVALADPQVVLLGGGWGRDPVVVRAVAERFGGMPRHVPVRAAAVEVEPALAGARRYALEQLRRVVLSSPSRDHGRVDVGWPRP